MKNKETLKEHLLKKFGEELTSTPINVVEDYAMIKAKVTLYECIIKASHDKLNSLK